MGTTLVGEDFSLAKHSDDVITQEGFKGGRNRRGRAKKAKRSQCGSAKYTNLILSLQGKLFEIWG
jgi:hypothetical protein